MSPEFTDRLLARLARMVDMLAPARLHGSTDRMLLEWAVLAFSVLAVVLLLMLSGVIYELGLQQVRFLAGEPFYMDALEAQVDLLGPGGVFCICIPVTLYASFLLLREPSFLQRAQYALLLLVALALPGILCVLWHGVLNMSAPCLCVLFTWLAVELKPLVKFLYYRYVRANLP
ncbi:MAG: hypothetical protein MJ058_09585 [Akkermansia sp.]|nr:hypothetical protein [Akkermansia sp.]